MKKSKKIPANSRTPVEKKQYQIGQFFFICCLLIIPLFNLDALIDPALLSKFTALSVSLFFTVFFYFLYAIKGRSFVDLSIFKEWGFAAFVVYLLFSCFSVFGAVNESEAIFDCLKNAVIFIFFLGSSFFIVNTKISAEFLTKIIAVFTTVIIILGMFQTLGVAAVSALTKESAKEITAVFMNKNLYAQMLFLTLPFNLFGWLTLKKRWKVMGAVNSVLALALMIVLFTRSVWLALIISSAFSLVFVWLYNRKQEEKLFVFKRNKALFVVSASIIITTLIIAASWGFDTQKGLTSKNFGSSPGRIAMWEKSLEMFKDQPLLGVGGGNWKIQISKYGVYDQLKMTGKKRFQRAHNDYLSILTEYGIFALLVFLGMLFIFFYYLFKIIHLSSEREEKIFYFLIFSGLSGYLVFSFFDYPKERIEHNIYFYFILSLIATKYHKLTTNSTRKQTAKKGFIVALPFLLVLASATYFGIVKINAEKKTKKAIDALHSNRTSTAIEIIDKNYTWLYELDPTATPVLWYKGLANFREGNNKEALKSFLDAIEVNPYHSHTYNSIGIIYATTGDFVQAKKYFLKSLVLRPYSVETIINVAKIYIQERNFEEAFNELLKVNPEINNNGFKIAMVQVLENKIEFIAKAITDSTIQTYVLELKASRPLSLAIYQSAVLNERSFQFEYLNYVGINMLETNDNLNPDQMKTLNGFLIDDIPKN